MLAAGDEALELVVGVPGGVASLLDSPPGLLLTGEDGLLSAGTELDVIGMVLGTITLLDPTPALPEEAAVGVGPTGRLDRETEVTVIGGKEKIGPASIVAQ